MVVMRMKLARVHPVLLGKSRGGSREGLVRFPFRLNLIVKLRISKIYVIE